MTCPQIVCHRGASRHAPENTFASADAALRLGGHYVELDVRESADGILYVLHDRTLDRTTNGAGEIAHLTSLEIDRLDAGSWFSNTFKGEPVPRLDAFLENLKGRAGAYVELKWCTPEKVARCIADIGMQEEVFTFSFKPEMYFGMCNAAPEMRRMITLGLARSPAVARDFFKATMVELEVAEATPGLVSACRSFGLETMIYYDGQDAEIFKHIADSNVDFVNLDHPDLFLAAVKA